MNSIYDLKIIKSKVSESYNYIKDSVAMKCYLIELETYGHKKGISKITHIIKVDKEDEDKKLPISIRHGQFIYEKSVSPTYKLIDLTTTISDKDIYLSLKNPECKKFIFFAEDAISNYENKNLSIYKSEEKEIDDLVYSYANTSELEEEYDDLN